MNVGDDTFHTQLKSMYSTEKRCVAGMENCHDNNSNGACSCGNGIAEQTRTKNVDGNFS